MPNVPTNSFPTVTSITPGSDTILVNASATSSKITGTNLSTSLGAVLTTGNQTIAGAKSFSGTIYSAAQAFVFPLYFFDSLAHAQSASYTFSTMGLDPNLTGLYFANNRQVVWSANANLNSFDKDTGIGRAGAGVVQLNNGTAAGAGILELPVSSSDAGSPSTGLRYYTKLSGGSMSYVVDAAGLVSFQKRTFKATGIDLTAGANTTVLTVPTGRTFYATDMWVVITNASGVSAGTTVILKESGASGQMIGAAGSITGSQMGTGVVTGDIIKVCGFLPSTGSQERKPCAAGNNVQAVVSAGTATTLVGDVYVEGFFT